MKIINDNAKPSLLLQRKGVFPDLDYTIEVEAWVKEDIIEISDTQWDDIFAGYQRMKMTSEGIMEYQSPSQYIKEKVQRYQ